MARERSRPRDPLLPTPERGLVLCGRIYDVEVVDISSWRAGTRALPDYLVPSRRHHPVL